MIPPFIAKIFAGKAKEIAGTVIGGLDNLFTSKEEKAQKEIELEQAINSHLEKMEELAIEEMKIEADLVKAELLDVQNARDNNAKIQESDKASWLSKNVGYILDLFLALLWGTVTIIIILKAFKVVGANVDLSSLLAIHGTVTAAFVMSLSFHRGSSVGSERKQKHMEKMNMSEQLPLKK